MSRRILWIMLAISPILIFSALTSAITLIPTCKAESNVKTQLCMVIDGSGTINSSEWSIIVQALAKGINESIPHDGSVELTVVQFGSWLGISARTEIPTTIVDNTNYAIISEQAFVIPKMGGDTFTANGVYLGWQEMRNSPNFAATVKHVINLATDDLPTARNRNATSDLDGDGQVDARDDLIAVVNEAVNQGLDEVDIEGIALLDSERDWFKSWVACPQPGVVAPPFSKSGWIRIVADATEFANTLGQKLQVVVSGEGEVWAPPAIGVFVTSIITVAVTSVVSSLASAVTNPETFPSQMVAQKISQAFPETLKKWLHEFISAKRKLIIQQRVGTVFTLTRLEVVSYAVALAVLTFAFSYAKAATLNQILLLIPVVLATSIIVEFCKNFLIVVIARSQGVWTEHRLWYFGLATFLFSVLVFKVPFSSPSRLTHNSPRFTRRSLGLVASAQVIIALVFAAVFYGVLTGGLTVIGNIGLVMCLTMAFFDSIPIPPMNGKDIYDWSRVFWIALFITALTLYVLCILLL